MLKRGQRRQELGHYEIELKVNNVLRGEAAEEQLYDLSAYVLDEQKTVSYTHLDVYKRQDHGYSVF